MSGPQGADRSAAGQRALSGSWRPAPELAAAASGVLVTTLAVYAYAGAGAAVAVVAGCAVAAVVYLRMLVPAIYRPEISEVLPSGHATSSLLGGWRKRERRND